MAKKKQNRKLLMWQKRLSDAQSAYQEQLDAMEERERAYRGEVEFEKLVKNDAAKAEDIKHVRNVIGELIEAQVDSTVAQPKVTALYPGDEALAKLAEDMLRNELERMPIRQINDMCQRITPTQGGVYYLIEWDNTKRSHTAIGEIKLTALHPRQVIPQDGVYTRIEDMDYIFIKLPQTKDYIRRKYGVEFDDDDVTEEEPEIRQVDGESTADDMCTQYLAYYRNDSGHIGMFSWVQDIVIADYEDYQARKQRKCVVCGEPEPDEDTEPEKQRDPLYPGIDLPLPEDVTIPERGKRKKVCSRCGNDKFDASDAEYETITEPVLTSAGMIDASPQAPVRIRYYKPDVYPIVLQRNVTAYGKLLGGSDVDMIYSQQQTINRVELSIINKLLTGGTITTLPANTKIRTDNEVGRYVHLNNPADKAVIGQIDLTVNIEPDVAYGAQVYEEMRQMIGITDSFQGREDSTATSKVAKEFAARQSAGRLESKREMRNAAYSELFEIMFKFRLAYTDEQRPVRANDQNGQVVYETFDRHYYIRQDDAGEYYYDDEFLFSVDAAASLASNREAMWQETRMNLQTGAFGDPAQLDTLILFWGKMELLHYPGAAETKAVLQERLQQMQQQMMAQQQMQMQQMQMQQMQAEDAARREAAAAEESARQESAAAEEAEMRRIDEIARKDAMRDALAMAKNRQAQNLQAQTAGNQA